MITIRVYGILINEQQQILLSDEYIRGMYITKFCGGGLEEGEGTREANGRKGFVLGEVDHRWLVENGSCCVDEQNQQERYKGAYHPRYHACHVFAC